MDAAVKLGALLEVEGVCNTLSLGLVQGSSFQFVCKETLSHSPSNLHNRGSVPLSRNHHRLVSDLVFLRTKI